MRRSRKNENELTEKQEKFCHYYLDTDGCASEAYRMAYNTANMQPPTIWSHACRMLDNPLIQKRISQIREQRRQESVIERNKVEKVLMSIVMADPNDFYMVDQETGNITLKTPNQLPKKIRNAIKNVKEGRYGLEYELSGKVEAARLLGSWNGWDAPRDINLNKNLTDDNVFLIGFGDMEED